MITQKDFAKTLKKFTETTKKFDKRTGFFVSAAKLMKRKLEVEAYLLILATWNIARFRIYLKKFDVEKFRRKVNALDKLFRAIKQESIKSVDLSAHEETIKKIFDTLAGIKGVEYTGASKVMHLKNPKLFVMWDDFIRGGKTKKSYRKLPIVTNHQWVPRKYSRNADGYLRFLKDMQCMFGHLKSPRKSKTLAKAIDEFNYVSITLPIQRKGD